MELDTTQANYKNMKENIERMRRRLLELLEKRNNNCADPEVQKTSMLLDDLIAIYLEAR